MKKYLVLICQKGRVPCKFEHYVEVQAGNEINARFIGFDSFVEKAKYTPSIKKEMQEKFLNFESICAPEAIEI